MMIEEYDTLTQIDDFPLESSLADGDSSPIEALLPVSEFAEVLDVHPSTVRNMIKDGIIEATKVEMGKTHIYLIARDQIAKAKNRPRPGRPSK